MDYGGSIVNYSDAVKLAKNGDNRGLTYLYESTYQSKYYLALKYMKNEEEAKDVLQDSYIKAFTKLDTLENPETFQGWFGMIVSNTAKNALKKKKPMLFTDVAVDSEKEVFEFEIEDDRVEHQPEILYTKKETQRLVREMIDSLTDEQRVCILMFEMEGFSIKEIANILECSENTVKSRLNYGRKNIKKQVEILQSKGYKLYSIAPLPLLLLLLQKEEKNLVQAGVLDKALTGLEEEVFSLVENKFVANKSIKDKSIQGNITTKSSGRMCGKGILHSTAFKVTAVTMALVITGGVATYSVRQLKNKQDAMVSDIQTSEENKSKEKEVVKQIEDDEYQDLIAGNLTKQELEFLFAYGPEEIPAEGFTEQDYSRIIDVMLDARRYDGGIGMECPIELIKMGIYPERNQYPLKDINRFMSAFTEYQFTEKEYGIEKNSIQVKGDIFEMMLASSSYSAEAKILSAEYTEEEMTVYYEYVRDYFGSSTDVKGKKKATLLPNADGKFRIVKLEDVSDVPNARENTSETSDGTVEEIYQSVWEKLKSEGAKSLFNDDDVYTGEMGYFLYDMDNDGTQELVVGAMCNLTPTWQSMKSRVFTCKKEENGYQLIEIEGTMHELYYNRPEDNNGLITLTFSPGTGWYSGTRYTVEKGAIKEEAFDCGFRWQSPEEKEFMERNPQLEWQQ